ncbi:MAG: hypothetical protein HY255_00200 [Betaproteobacteria bacterium]|nr:hypothetical protein [Betaproteobacteria bacterium]
MRTIAVWIGLLAVACAGAATAGEKARALNLETIGNARAWKVYNTEANAVEFKGKSAAYLRATGDSANGSYGLALPIGLEFETGAIELDLRGKSERGRSFLGVAFNVTDDHAFEVIYFRPFNFKADEPFRRRAVQYISAPGNGWEVLRKNFPGKFENAVNPVPDPDDWFHARIEVSDKQVRVFVGHAKTPSLVVDRIAENRKKRPMGLFVDSADGYYRNVKVIQGM